MSRIERVGALISWMLLAIILCFAALIANWTVSPEQVVLLLILALALIGGTVLIATVLGILYRAYFQYWPTWALVIAVTLVGGIVSRSPNLPAAVTLLGTLSFIGCGTALLVAIIFLLFRRDIAFPLLGILSLVLVWFPVLWYYVRGDFLADLLSFLSVGANQNSLLSWFITLFTSTLCLIPIAATSFLWHTLRVFSREFIQQRSQ